MPAARRAALSPKNARRPAWWTARSLPGNNRQNRRERTRTGRKNFGRHDTRRVPSREMPPPGDDHVHVRICVIAEPQLWSMAVMPILAPSLAGIGGDR